MSIYGLKNGKNEEETFIPKSLLRPLFWLLLLSGLWFVLSQLSPIITPFISGIILAYIFSPLVGKLTDLGFSRLFATILVSFCFIAGIIALLFAILPFLHTELLYFVKLIPSYARTLQNYGVHLSQELTTHIADEHLSQIQATVSNYIGSLFSWLGNFFLQVLTRGWAFANLIALMIITPIVMFYFLKDWKKLLAMLKNWIPRQNVKAVTSLSEQIDQAISGFVRGQALVCLILALYYSISLWIVGLDFGFSIGLLTGLFTVVPYIGVFCGFIAAFIIAFSQFQSWLSISLVCGIFAVGSITESYFLTPKLVGDRVGLHPLWIMFALLSGATLFGFIGVLVAVPTAAIIGVFVRFALGRYLKSSLYEESSKAPRHPE